MPFKIVQTLEKGRPRLCIVPSIWEEDGKLFWPTEKIKNRARLVRDETSFPSPNWDILDCTVKRNNIETYMAAEYEVQIMENHTDTDNETSVTACYQSASNVNNFEDIVQNLTHTNNTAMDPSQVTQNMVMDETILLPTFDWDQLINNQNLLLQKMNKQEKILHNIVENMQKIIHKVASLSVQISEELATITETTCQPDSVVLLKDAKPEEIQSFRLEIINDREHLEILDNNLKDKAERLKLHKQLSFLFQPCEGNGITYAYKLLDSLMSREFLCKCSWSGASRGDVSKIPLKDFKNFIKFFCYMIRSWDPTFTMAQTENFFKVCLKNAVKRRAMKDLRASSKRNRMIEPKSQNSAINTNKPVPSTSKGFFKATKNQNSPKDQIYEINIEPYKSLGLEEENEKEGRKENISIEEEELSDSLC